MPGRVWKWLSDRFGFKPVGENFLFRRVPKGPWYAGDGQAMLVLLATQLITGAFLALSYSASLENAYQSVNHITTQQTAGWFVRSLHYWSGGIWVVVLIYHVFRQILIGGYKSPREGTWLLGVALLYIVFMMSLIGYVLRWDERGIYGLRVALNIFQRVPVVGDEIVLLVLGGPEITTLTLTRLYAVHVIIGPALLVALASYHLYLVVIRGTTTPTELEQPVADAVEQKKVYKRDARSEERGELFFPHTISRLMPMWLLVFAVTVALAFFRGPAVLYPEANLTQTSFPIEEWWFAWFSSAAALLPPSVAPWFYVLFPLILLVVLVALPFVDRGPYRGIQNRPIAVAAVVLCVGVIVYLSSLRQRSPWTAWPGDEPPPVPADVQLTERVERGRQLFAVYGCNSCHAVSGHGPAFAPDLADLSGRYSLEGLREYVLNPPEDVAMPAYQGRISEEDLALVVEFVHTAQTFAPVH